VYVLHVGFKWLAMKFFDVLPVRFHFNGEFLRNSNDLFYVGGTQAMSYVDRDKLSLPEVLGHLRDHCDVKEGTMLHWLFPERDMRTGLVTEPSNL